LKRGRIQGTDELQDKTRQANLDNILKYIETANNWLSTKDLVDLTKLSRPTIEACCKQLVEMKKIEVREKPREYISPKGALKKKYEEYIKGFKESAAPLYVEPRFFSENRLKMGESRRLSKKEVEHHHMDMMWIYGTDIRLWGNGLKQNEYEIIDRDSFKKVQELIESLLKRSVVKKLGDSMMAIEITFDLPSALATLSQQYGKGNASLTREWNEVFFKAAINILDEAEVSKIVNKIERLREKNI